MKKHASLFICLAILLASLFILFKAFKSADDFSAPAPSITAIKETPVKHYRDAAGIDHAEKPVAIADLNTIKASYQNIIDSLTRQLKIKAKNMQEVVQVSTNTEGTFKPKIDTIPADEPEATSSIEVSYKDAWLEINGVVTQDSLWHYKVHDSLTFVTYKKKTGFLKRQLFLDGSSMNPNSKIAGITAIKISPPVKRWGVGIITGYGYAFAGKRPTWFVGAGVSRTFLRF